MTVTKTAAPPTGLAPVRETLPNGVTVLCKETRVTPAVTLHASIRAGAICDPPRLDGVSHFVSRTLDRGTHTRSADQIAEDLENRGAALTVSVPSTARRGSMSPTTASESASGATCAR